MNGSGLKIVCATNMPFVLEAFSTLGEARVLEGRRITAADVRDADLLAIRSTTVVDRGLLEGSRVRFVGTATIGTDHLDTAYFARAGIEWCYAPGCNANSVSEYLVAALLVLGRRHGLTLQGKTIGVIGVGNVGSRVVRKMRALGLRVLMHDPPRERGIDPPTGAGNVEPFEPGPFVSRDAILEESDIITLHVPLIREGPERTRHMVDRGFLARVRRGCVFINAARGGLVDTNALIDAVAAGVVGHTVLDTWEGEPDCRPDAVARADIATPHIAGHSFEGRVMGTVMVYQAACRFLGVKPAWSHEAFMPPSDVPELAADGRSDPEEAVLGNLVGKVYDIEADDRRFRATMSDDGTVRAAGFDRLRKEYPKRREFHGTRVSVRHGAPSLWSKISGLGFRAA